MSTQTDAMTCRQRNTKIASAVFLVLLFLPAVAFLFWMKSGECRFIIPQELDHVDFQDYPSFVALNWLKFLCFPFADLFPGTPSVYWQLVFPEIIFILQALWFSTGNHFFRKIFLAGKEERDSRASCRLPLPFAPDLTLPFQVSSNAEGNSTERMTKRLLLLNASLFLLCFFLVLIGTLLNPATAIGLIIRCHAIDLLLLLIVFRVVFKTGVSLAFMEKPARLCRLAALFVFCILLAFLIGYSVLRQRQARELTHEMADALSSSDFLRQYRPTGHSAEQTQTENNEFIMLKLARECQPFLVYAEQKAFPKRQIGMEEVWPGAMGDEAGKEGDSTRGDLAAEEDGQADDGYSDFQANTLDDDAPLPDTLHLVAVDNRAFADFLVYRRRQRDNLTVEHMASPKARRLLHSHLEKMEPLFALQDELADKAGSLDREMRFRHYSSHPGQGSTEDLANFNTLRAGLFLAFDCYRLRILDAIVSDNRRGIADLVSRLCVYMRIYLEDNILPHSSASDEAAAKSFRETLAIALASRGLTMADLSCMKDNLLALHEVSQSLPQENLRQFASEMVTFAHARADSSDSDMNCLFATPLTLLIQHDLQVALNNLRVFSDDFPIQSLWQSIARLREAMPEHSLGNSFNPYAVPKAESLLSLQIMAGELEQHALLITAMRTSCLAVAAEEFAVGREGETLESLEQLGLPFGAINEETGESLAFLLPYLSKRDYIQAMVVVNDLHL